MSFISRLPGPLLVPLCCIVGVIAGAIVVLSASNLSPRAKRSTVETLFVFGALLAVGGALWLLPAPVGSGGTGVLVLIVLAFTLGGAGIPLVLATVLFPATEWRGPALRWRAAFLGGCVLFLGLNLVNHSSWVWIRGFPAPYWYVSDAIISINGESPSPLLLAGLVFDLSFGAGLAALLSLVFRHLHRRKGKGG